MPHSHVLLLRIVLIIVIIILKIVNCCVAHMFCGPAQKLSLRLEHLSPAAGRAEKTSLSYQCSLGVISDEITPQPNTCFQG